MSDNLKNLFKSKGDLTSLSDKSITEIANETNSKTDKYVDARSIEIDRFVPHVDFSSASNFVKFGSAERYYADAISRIIDFYPYDGSGVEKLQWQNSSSYLDLHIFDNEYPRTNGYITIGADGYALDSNQPGNPSTKEYVLFYGGPNTASVGMAGKPLASTFSGSNVFDAASDRESNLKFDLSDDGATVELWVKFGEIDRTTTTPKQTIFDLNNNQAVGSADSPGGRLWIYLNNSAEVTDEENGFIVHVESGSINETITAYSIDDGFSLSNTGSWNHYAFTLKNSGDDLSVETYENGLLKKSVTAPSKAINAVTGGLRATIGAQEYSVTMMSNSFGAYLDGTGDYFVINSASLTPAEDLGIGGPGTSPDWYSSWDGFSFSTWVKADSNARGTTIFSAGEAVTGGAAAGTRAPWRVMMSDVGTLAWVYAAGTVTTHWYDSSISIEDDEWHHVAFTTGSANSGNGAKLYVDGVGVTTAYSGLLTLKDDYYVAIGADYISGSWSQDWSGSLDEMSVWSRELPAGEVVGMYNNGAPTNLSGGLDLQAWYRCGDSASFGTTLADSAKTNDAVTVGDPARISTALSLPTAATGSRGWFKLSGSVDEFRYWKTRRTAKEIGLNWLDQVEGGVNTDDATSKLGVYYKFNEGVTTNTATDEKVLDYSGRITNGTFVGYTTGARNTGSAIVEASASTFEFKDPILYRSHPDVITLGDNLKLSGSYYDSNNVSSLYHSIPSWIQEEDEGGALQNLTQIMSSYFDNVYLQINALPTFRDNDTYTSASNKPYPFAREMLESAGLTTPELFVDADISEILGSRSDNKIFKEDINDVKNRIYENIYNNLVHIYKTKGTAGSFKNLVRCFGIDEDVIELKVYGNNIEFELEENLQNKTFRKNYANFHAADNFSATCYQHTSSDNANSVAYLGSSHNLTDGFGITFEAEVILPTIYDRSDGLQFLEVDFLSSSLFGIHTPNEDHTVTAWDPYDPANFQVHAVKEYTPGQPSLGEIKFVLTSSNADAATEGFISELTSTTFPEGYKNKRWNFAVKVAPEAYPQSCLMSGSCGTAGTGGEYKVEFYGTCMEYDIVQHSFYVTSSMTLAQGQMFLSSSKRVYAGAHKTDFTGSTLQKSDAKISSVRAWLDVLSNDEVLAHAKDPTSFGRLHPYRQAYMVQGTGSGYSIENYIPRINTRMLDWDFALVTGSSATGEFEVVDVSSGSLAAASGSGWFGHLLNLQHPGVGYGFSGSATNVVDGNYVYAQKQRGLENLNSTDMINVLSNDDIYFEKNSRPINYYFSMEKSMYDAVSREMLEFFATIKDFNNLIGETVSRYRPAYKDLDKMRQLFFDRVDNELIDFEKYLEYYKWIDQSVSAMLEQLVPASARFSGGVRTMVTSHTLERNKYWNKFPMVENKLPATIAGVMSSPALGGDSPYPWKYGHAPVVEGEFINDYYARFSNCVYAINSGSSNPLGQLGMAPPVASSGWTLSVWIRNGLGPFFSTADGGAHDPEIMINYLNPSGDDGLIQFYDLSGASAIRTATFPDSHDGNWHHLVVVYQYGEGSGADGSGARDLLALYGDGQTLTLSSADIEIDLAADGDIYIGAWATSHAVSSEFAGDMDEFSIWTQAPGVGGTPLVAELYNDGKPWDLRTDSTRLAAWYRMGDSAESATILADSANYSNASYPSTAPQNATAIQVAASPDTVVYLLGGPTGSSPSVNTNCFWWKNRAEPVNTLISSSVASVNADRTSLHDALYQTFDRRSNSPVQLSAVETNDIKSGQNSLSNNHKEKSVLSSFSNIENEANMDLYDDYVYISGSELEQFVDCSDLLKPTYRNQETSSNPAGEPASKKKVFYQSYTGHDSIGQQTGVRKENTPLSFYSSSMTASGYVVEVQDVDGFEGLDITNLHDDSYGSNLEIPMQGPFTEKYVGGYQYRHIDINYRNSQKQFLDNLYTRPEGYKILFPNEVGGSPGCLVISGPATARTGSIGSAYFDNVPGAIDDGKGYQSVVDATTLDLRTDFTLAAWVKTDADFSADSHGGIIFAIVSSIDPFSPTLWLYIDENNKFSVCDITTPGTPDLQYDVVINDGNWHHVALTFDESPSKTAILYVDGVSRDSGTAINFNITHGATVLLGTDKAATSGDPDYDHSFSGYIREIAAWDTILDSSDITGLSAVNDGFNERYGGGVTPPNITDDYAAGLQAWWRFGGAGAAITADSSGNSNTLTAINGGATLSTETPGIRNNAIYDYLPFANRMRETYAKRPVNIANIQQVTSSGITKIGNFEKNYQVVQTSGRKANNLFIESLSITNSESSYVTGVIDYSLPERSTNKTVITERFSAPGSGEVMARGTRDYTSEEYSPYNAMPWRNLSVRQPLDSLLKEHSGKYGLKAYTLSSSYQLNNVPTHVTAAYSKINRNTARRYENDARFENKHSVYFDATNDFYVSQQTAADLGLADSSFSMFSWAKVPTGYSPGGTAGHVLSGTIVSLGADEAFSDFSLMIDSNLKLSVFTNWQGSSAAWITSSANTIVENQWHHVGMTGRYNGDGGITYATIYVDGEAVSNSDYAVNILDNDPPAVTDFSGSLTTTAQVGVGAEDLTLNHEFHGWITDVSIWNTELTGSDITQLYKFSPEGLAGPVDLTLHPASASLVTWYRMGDGDELTAYSAPYALRDSSPKDSLAPRHVVVNNSPQVTLVAPAGSPVPSPGKFEAIQEQKCVYLSGTPYYNGGITAGDLQLLDDFSISMWIKPETPAGDWGYVFQIGPFGGEEGQVVIRASDGRVVADRTNVGSLPPELESTNPIVDGNWHHVVVTLDNSEDDFSLYVDGDLNDIDTTEVFSVAASDPIYIGATPAATSKYAGSISEMTVWNTLLSAAQVRELYRYAGLSSSMPGPVNPYNLAVSRDGILGSLKAWWRFGDTPADTATSIVDCATGSFTLTANGTPELRDSNLTSSNFVKATPGTPVYDNWFVQHAIPQSDLQYMWITSSYQSSKALGYATASDDITFVSASEFGSYRGDTRYWGNPFSGSNFIFTDFVGLNTNVYEPVGDAPIVNFAHFNGTGDRFVLNEDPDPTVVLGPAVALNIIGDFSISFWIKAETPEGTYGFIFSCDDQQSSPAVDEFMMFVRASDGKLCSDGLEEGSPGLVSTNSVVDGKWHHVVVTFDDGDNDAFLYIDGVENDVDLSEDIHIQSADYVTIGADKDADPSDYRYFYKGDLAQFAVWSAALTADQVSRLYYTHGQQPIDGMFSGDASPPTLEAVFLFTPNSDNLITADIKSIVKGTHYRSYGIPRKIDNSTTRGIINAGTVTLPYNTGRASTNSDNTLGWAPGADLVTWMPGQSEQYRNVDTVPALLNNTTQSAEMFNALMLHRNGPYQYPSWKQIRAGQSPIIRGQRKTNVMSYLPKMKESVEAFGSDYMNLNDPTRMVHPPAIAYSQERAAMHPQNNLFGARSTFVRHLTESVVTSKYRPLVHEFGEVGDPAYVPMADTYGNNLVTFTSYNENTKGTTLIGDLGINSAPTRRRQIHSLLQRQGPVNQRLSRVSYKETVFPREKNTYLKKVRQRENFIVDFWHPDRNERTETYVSNSMGSHSAPTNLPLVTSQSMWCLDGRINPYLTGSPATGTSDNVSGELLNPYTIEYDSAPTGPNTLTASAIYTRVGVDDIYSVPWVAGEQAGKDPFYYPSYDAYADDMKRYGKDYTIIPEFKISDYMDYYIMQKGKDFRAPLPAQGFLNLTGATLNASTTPDAIASSSMEGFFDVYSTTDFLRHFKHVAQAASNMSVGDWDTRSNADKASGMQPTQLTLECNAAMKFLPYKGFYPAQRTLELASLLSKSYGRNVEVSGTVLGSNTDQGNFRTFLQPFCSPGILYNTIKGGVAVDYPIYASEDAAGLEVNAAGITTSASFRAPFEALVEPEWLARTNIIDNEISRAKLNSTASWNGSGDDRYKMAMHNFLAESIDFFLLDGQLTSFASDSDAKGFLADPTKMYIMDIKIRPSGSREGGSQPAGNIMYNRDLNDASDGMGEFFGPRVQGVTGGPPTSGYSYTYSPPYYDYECLARVSFEPPNPAGEDQSYTLREILNASTVKYYHIMPNYLWKSIVVDGLGEGPLWDDWMQISASVNIGRDTTDFVLVDAKKVNFDAITGAPRTVESGEGEVLVFQTRFETPILDFSSGSLDKAGRSPLSPGAVSTEKTIRGMWHQYGVDLADGDGLFLEVADPIVSDVNDFYHILANTGSGGFDASVTGSLAGLIGMPKRAIKLGQSRERKVVKEAVIAIPFKPSQGPGGKEYYTLDKDAVVSAKGRIQSGNIPLGTSRIRPIFEQLLKMENYVLPPMFDFLTYDDQDPIAMYIFEFEHELSRKDITDIWQNLPPDTISSKYQTAKATISHDLLAGTFLSPDSETGSDIDDIKWLVFKVKQKANWNYYKKTHDTSDDERFQFDLKVGRGAGGRKFGVPDYSYNWPYDFFSLVELVKLDANVTFESPAAARTRLKKIDEANARMIEEAMAARGNAGK